MTSPQQPKRTSDATTIDPVPPDNEPGHHPAVEQDKPRRAPQLPPRHHRFGFRRSPWALAGLPFGVTVDNAYVDVDDDRLSIRFGPWTLHTPVSNIAGASRTGPYQWWKVVGPPHLSLRDRGITFATATEEGVCIRFRQAVPALLPFDQVRHPAVTVTVDETDDLVRLVEQLAG